MLRLPAQVGAHGLECGLNPPASQEPGHVRIGLALLVGRAGPWMFGRRPGPKAAPDKGHRGPAVPNMVILKRIAHSTRGSGQRTNPAVRDPTSRQTAGHGTGTRSSPGHQPIGHEEPLRLPGLLALATQSVFTVGTRLTNFRTHVLYCSVFTIRRYVSCSGSFCSEPRLTWSKGV